MRDIEPVIDVTNWGVTTLKILSGTQVFAFEISEDELWPEEALQEAYMTIQQARGLDPWTGEPLYNAAETAAPSNSRALNGRGNAPDLEQNKKTSPED